MLRSPEAVGYAVRSAGGLVEEPTERDGARFLPGRLTVPVIAHDLGVSTTRSRASVPRGAGAVARELGIVR